MNWNNYFNWLSVKYRIEITQPLRDTLKEHFGVNLNIYTEQDMYEQTRKIIQSFKNHKR